MTEGEAFVYAGGGVGVFGEVGVPEAALQPKKWTRIVITLGSAWDSTAAEESFSMRGLQPKAKARPKYMSRNSNMENSSMDMAYEAGGSSDSGYDSRSYLRRGGLTR
jgi:hypothetical protein